MNMPTIAMIRAIMSFEVKTCISGKIDAYEIPTSSNERNEIIENIVVAVASWWLRMFQNLVRSAKNNAITLIASVILTSVVRNAPRIAQQLVFESEHERLHTKACEIMYANAFPSKSIMVPRI